MERYAQGDAAAFEPLYDVLAPRLHGYLLRQTRDPARAEDLVQQTFLQIHRARGSFFRGADVIPWAYAIARRLLIDGSRRRSEVLRADEDDDETFASLHSSDGLPESELVARQLGRRLFAVLAQLPVNQRTAFELVKQEGLSLADAASVLGATLTAVKLRLHRANEALRAAAIEENEVNL